MNKVFFVIVLVFLIEGFKATYTLLKWSQCNEPNIYPAGYLFNVDVEPMPIQHPGSNLLNITGRLIRNIQGPLRTEIVLKRNILGLPLRLGCYSINGISVGSCSYADLCEFIMKIGELNENNCPREALRYGIDCKCPFKIHKQSLHLSREIFVPDLSTSMVSMILSSGDFSIQIHSHDNIGFIGCIDVKFSLKHLK